MKFKRKLLALNMLFLIPCWIFSQVSLPHYEGFEYSSGDLPLSSWTSVNSGDSIKVVSNSLSYPNLSLPKGNKVYFKEWGLDYQKEFTAQTAGTVYFSFLLNVPSLASLDTTGYFIGLASGSTTFGGVAWLSKSGSGYKIGLSPRTTVSTITYSSVKTVGTTYFVVVSYEIVSGSNNDVVKLWINPTPGGSQPTETLSATNTGTDLSTVKLIFLRQDSQSETPEIEIDEIRIGTSWADVTPGGAPAVPLTAINLYVQNNDTAITTVAGTKQAYTNVSPKNASDTSVTWSVKNKTGRATLSSSGLVTAEKNGLVTIIATSNDGTDIKDSINILISGQPKIIDATGVTLTAPSRIINAVGATLQLTATVLPDSASVKTVNWSSSSTSVATVNSSGLVTAVASGSAIITATHTSQTNLYDTFQVNVVLPVSITSIYEIQYTSDPSGDSPKKDQTVTTSGIVTGIVLKSDKINISAYFIQSGVGKWNGVYVYDDKNAVTLGDSVVFTAKVTEYYNLTELTNITDFTKVSSGKTLPQPASINTGDLTEDYEGVLIRFNSVSCNRLANKYGEWSVYTSNIADTILVDDDCYKNYSPVPDAPSLTKKYDIIGFGHYGYSKWRILPRNASDISISTAIGDVENEYDFSVYPVPAVDFINIESNSFISLVSLYDFLGRKIIEQEFNSMNGSINVSNLPSGIYFVKVNEENMVKIIIQ